MGENQKRIEKPNNTHKHRGKGWATRRGAARRAVQGCLKDGVEWVQVRRRNTEEGRGWASHAHRKGKRKKKIKKRKKEKNVQQ